MPVDSKVNDLRDLLIRLDERSSSIQKEIATIQKQIDALNDDLEKNYVTKESFAPFQRAIYSTVGLIVTAVVGSILSLILVK